MANQTIDISSYDIKELIKNEKMGFNEGRGRIKVELKDDGNIELDNVNYEIKDSCLIIGMSFKIMSTEDYLKKIIDGEFIGYDIDTLLEEEIFTEDEIKMFVLKGIDIKNRYKTIEVNKLINLLKNKYGKDSLKIKQRVECYYCYYGKALIEHINEENIIETEMKPNGTYTKEMEIIEKNEIIERMGIDEEIEMGLEDEIRKRVDEMRYVNVGIKIILE